MTKKISFFLVAALAVFILCVACESDGGGEGGASYTVTFLRNNDDPDSGPEKVTVKVPAGGRVGDKMPDSQYAKVDDGWDAGYMVTGWNTSSAGSGGKWFNSRNAITEDWTVYARWGYNESQYVDGNGNLTVIAPAIEQGGNMHDVYNGTQNDNGSITWSRGGIRWAYPAEDSSDYDYVEIKYVGKGATDSATAIPSNILKQYNTTSDYMSETGTQYPTFGLTGSLKFKVKKGGGGIAIQINVPSNVTNTDSYKRTMKFTRATFTKGQRFTITFSLDFDGAPVMPDMVGVKDFEIGDLPYPEVSKPDCLFNGWVYSENDQPVNATDKITGALSLKATWVPIVSAQKIDVNFNVALLTAMGTGTTAVLLTGGENGYTFTYGHSGYSGSWAKFTVTLDAGVNLSAYKEVTFKYKSEGGDTPYKPFALLAASPLNQLPNEPHMEGSTVRINSIAVQCSTTENWKDEKFTIDKSKAFNLKGIIEICIYDHSGPDKDGVRTAWSIKDVSFIPE